MPYPFDESHPCTYPGCTTTVEFDDEPACYIHSPDKGSFKMGYSYKEEHAKATAQLEDFVRDGLDTD